MMRAVRALFEDFERGEGLAVREDAVEQPTGIRLQKVLAQAGVASRRHAEEIILAGRVAVNGTTIKTLGTRVQAGDRVALDGRLILARERLHYYLLNKPVGVITSAQDPQGRPTVLELLSKVPVRVYPVGRLDFDTSGLLLLTNDGELANRLTHPRYGVEKTYRVIVQERVQAEDVNKLRAGVLLEDGSTAPARVKTLGEQRGFEVLEISIHEGKNRQVRRMFEAVGHCVLKLERVRFGPLRLENTLTPGDFRELSLMEVQALEKSVGLSRN